MDSAYSMEREFEFTAQHFNKVRNDLYDYAGIVLADHKQDMAYNRLVRRLRALKLENFEQYFSYIQENPKEFQQFINALTTNLSAFFRERHHFDFIADDVLPEMRQGGTRKLRIWSAGCSHGEEAYSLAMTIVDNLPELEQYDVKILATDIDS
ncbi:MAG: CheR family methyltransferase, partial [Pseudomonadales bacterium]